MRLRVLAWGKRIAKWGAVFAALSVVAVLVLVHNLDQPWVKRRVRTIVAKELGVDIDYGTVRLALSSGIDVDDLVVFSPAEMRGAVPELARVGHLAAVWTHGHVERLTLTDVAVTIAVDENGRTSLAPLFPGRVPLSHQPASLLASLPADRIDASRVAVTVVDTDHGAVVERTILRGLALELQAERDGRGARLRLGSDSAPLALELERHGSAVAEGTARARGHAFAVATPADVALTIDLRDVDQDFVPSTGAGRALNAAARARFDARAARTDVMLDAGSTEGAAQGFVTVPDEGALVLHRVIGDLDASRVIPAERANLRCRIVEATLSNPPRLAEGGGIDIAGEIDTLRIAVSEESSLRADTGSLAFRVLPDASSAALHGSFALDGVTLGDTRATGVKIRVDGRTSPSGGFELALTGDVASVSTRSTDASAIALTAHARLAGLAPYAARVELTAARLRSFGFDGPARVAIDATEVMPDFARPIASIGKAHVDLALGDARAEIDAAKAIDAVDFELHASAPSLERVRPLMPAEAAAFLPTTTAVRLESEGRVERLSSALPEIRHRSKLNLDRPELGALSARSLAVVVDARGTMMRHDAEIDLRARELSIAGKGAGDEHVTLSAKLDRARPAVRLIASSDGIATAKLAIAASFDRARRVLAYDVDGSASKLAALAPLLSDVPGLQHVDFSAVEVGASMKGDLLGVIASVDGDGAVRLEPHPALTAALNGPMDIRVEHFGFGRGDLALAVPKLELHADFGLAGGRRTLASRLDIGSAYLVWGAHEVDIGHISDRFSATVAGDLRNPDAEVEDHLAFSDVLQEFIPGYPTADVSVDLAARRDQRGTVRVDRLELASAKGGTKISLAGNLDVGGARKLALEGAIEQDIARLSATEAGGFGGRGRARAKVRVESADLVVFRTRSDVQLEGVDLGLAREGIAVEALYGEIPIRLDFSAAGGRVTLVHGRQASPFALLRFADQQPLLSRTSFLRARSITTPYTSIGPFVGNLQIDHGVVSLAQVEMGVHGGRVTGACTLDYADEGSTLEVHLRASGIRSSNGELLDANAAFFVSQKDSSVDGRGEIVRIGEQQFIELLDLVDPRHVNASVNRVRRALGWGYPARVNLAFDHGFANAHVELGGLASLFRVGDIRGIPTGPVFERMLRTRHGPKGRR